MRFWLFDVMEDPLSVCIRHNAAKVARSIIADSGAKDDGLCVPVLEELEHLVQGERAADVGIDDKESIGSTLQYGVTEVIETTSCSQGLIFSKVLDLDLGKFAGGVFDEVTEHALVVVPNDDDFSDIRDFGDGSQAVPDDGMASDIEEWLQHIVNAQWLLVVRKVSDLGYV